MLSRTKLHPNPAVWVLSDILFELFLDLIFQGKKNSSAVTPNAPSSPAEELDLATTLNNAISHNYKGMESRMQKKVRPH